jgi:hypothetical protein
MVFLAISFSALATLDTRILFDFSMKLFYFPTVSVDGLDIL